MKKFIVILCVIIAFFFTQCSRQYEANQKVIPIATNGIIDASEWDFENDGIIKLNGQWEFYWGEFFKHNDFIDENQPINKNYIDALKYWNNLEIDGKKLPSFGYATYRLQIKINPKYKSQIFGFKTNGQSSAYTLYIDDKPILSNGIASETKNGTKHQWFSKIGFFEIKSDIIEVIVHISNFTHRNGGMWNDILFGMQSHIQRERFINVSLDLFWFSAIFFMGLYHLALFIIRKKDKSTLFFGLFCIAMSIRNLMTNERLLAYFLNLDLFVAYKFELMSTYIALPLVSLSIYYMYKNIFPSILFYIILILSLLVSLFVLFSSTYLSSFVVFPFGIISAVIVLALIVVIFIASLKREEGANIILVGLIIGIIAIINDTLHSQNIIRTFYMMQFGVFIFLFLQSYVIALRFSKAFTKVEHLSEKLIEMDKMKDEFLANTSHELKTPLNGIIGIAESLIDGATGELNDEAKSNLSMISNSGRRLLNLVNELLDFSKLKEGEIIIKRKPVDIKAITDIIIAFVKPLIKDKPVTIINKIDEDIPFIEGDEERIQQIMYNLIGNAIKFTPKGEITISADKISNSFIKVCVSDTGIGIPEDKIGSIFKSFEQVDASISREYGGTGLGLSITKKLIELHNGTIRVETKLNKGSTFIFTMPISKKTSSSVEKVIPTKEISEIIIPEDNIIELIKDEKNYSKQKSEKKNGKIKILAIDDEPINLQVIYNQLSMKDYEVVTASSGMMALDMINKGLAPDLVLLDIMMPKMSGYDVCLEIRKKHPIYELPIIFLTVKNQINDIMTSFSVGANDYIEKPFSKKELIARIKTHTNLSKITVASSYFVPKDFLNILGKDSIVDIKLGETIQKEMTIMFSDIRSYTTLSEDAKPKEIFEFLNEYLGIVGPIIKENKGFVSHYSGDGFLALFHKSEDSINATIRMKQEINLFNEERKKKNLDAIRVGIGLHTGEVMIGIIGDKYRLDSSVISDAVNLASRIEGLTKFFGVSAAISGETFEKLVDKTKYNHRFLGRVRVKGKNIPVDVYEIFDGDEERIKELKIKTLEDYNNGMEYYLNRMFVEAKESFTRVTDINPEDRISLLYEDYSIIYSEKEPPPQWDGVITTNFK